MVIGILRRDFSVGNFIPVGLAREIPARENVPKRNLLNRQRVAIPDDGRSGGGGEVTVELSTAN